MFHISQELKILSGCWLIPVDHREFISFLYGTYWNFRPCYLCCDDTATTSLLMKGQIWAVRILMAFIVIVSPLPMCRGCFLSPIDGGTWNSECNSLFALSVTSSVPCFGSLTQRICHFCTSLCHCLGSVEFLHHTWYPGIWVEQPF